MAESGGKTTQIVVKTRLGAAKYLVRMFIVCGKDMELKQLIMTLGPSDAILMNTCVVCVRVVLLIELHTKING